MLALVSIAVSTLLLIALCAGDPKRRRAARAGSEGQGTATRRLLAAAACLPGLLCVLLGDPAAFLIWLGGCGAAGWLVTLWFGQRHAGRSGG
ncbi:hypothetical protein [Sphingomonas solaris]|nr:hypothetical protein [Sphingomonas solaris]